MPTTLEYAFLSANVYGNSEDVRKPQNTLPIPDGWTPLGAGVVLADGFMARAYQNGNEIVVSYAGTTDENGLDWLTGNVPAATAATLAPQVLDAAGFYLDVLAAHPSASISFTGHSLGGGLASLMAVYFDKYAAVFDEAPFQKSADSLTVVTALKLELIALGYDLPAELSSYVALDPTGALIPSPTRFARQGNVDQLYVSGEALSLASTALTNYISIALGLASPVLWVLGTGVDKVRGSQTTIDPKAQTMLGWGPASVPQVSGDPVDLHSISLLAGFLQSPQFLATANAHPELLPRLFAGLFKNDPKLKQANLVDLLVQREYRGEGSLGALATDVDKIDPKNGLTSVTELPNSSNTLTKINVASILVDAVLAGLYEQGKDRAPEQTGLAQFQTLLRSTTGGLTVDVSSLGDEAEPVEHELGELLDALIGDGTIGAAVTRQARWTLQSGSTALQASQVSDGRADVMLGYTGNDAMDGGAGDDILAGYGGADTLTGGDGHDMLYGGDGEDTLDGGANGDWLLGGAGTDTYTFSDAFGQDVIDDSDGQGNIVADGQTIDGAGAKKTSPTTWQTDDKKTTFALVTVDGTHDKLVVTFAGKTDRITIDNWSTSNSLGITLSDTPVLPPTPDNTFTGDYTKKLNSNDPTVYVLDDFHNYANDGLQAGAQDVLTGTNGKDVIKGLGGNDGLSGNDGDDSIEGGDGDDLMFGGWGADTINGGAGRDFIYGSGVGALGYPAKTTDDPPAAQGPEYTRGFSWVTYDAGIDGNAIKTYQIVGAYANTLYADAGNVIDGGAGDDWIRSGSGGDTVHGGDDKDNIVGLAGNDVLFGDDGDDIIAGDGLDAQGYIETVPGDWHGNDVLVGGKGNDSMYGQGGSDELYGGEGDDVLYGDDFEAKSTPYANHGNDYLDGGDGNDTLFGGGRDDELFGGIGNDVLIGDDDPSKLPGDYHGDDYLDGEDGDDTLVGCGGDDTLVGGIGNDSLWGDAGNLDKAYHGNDDLDGGDGNDYLDGGSGEDVLTGGEGIDTLLGGADGDELYGDAGNDKLSGDDGDDDLDGGDGDDSLLGGAGNDSLYAGIGNDTLFGQDGDDHLDGEDGDDTLVGGDGNDELFGGTGKDLLAGEAGDDSLDGEDGDDELQGGDGNDSLFGAAGNDTLFGQEGDDYLDGEDGDDGLMGGGGNDLLFGSSGNDQLFGEDGDDHLDGEDGNDSLVGGAGNDTLIGGSGNDALWAIAGNNRLEGGDGDDTLIGGTRDDTLVGGGGHDYLSGGGPMFSPRATPAAWRSPRPSTMPTGRTTWSSSARSRWTT